MLVLHRSVRLLPHGCSAISCVRAIAICVTLALAFPWAFQPAHAHGIAGNRLFPGTMSFEDPAVMDELVLNGTSQKHPPESGNDVVDNTFSWEFSRLLTPTLSLSVGNGYIHRNWGSMSRSGFDETSLLLKTLLWQNDLHEVMISAGFGGSIGTSGAQGVGANQFSTLGPSLFFGKGFGDAPAALAWLRPFAISGLLSAEVPTAKTSMTLDNSIAGQLVPDAVCDKHGSALGIVDPVQHLLSHTAVHAGPVAEPGTTLSVHPPRRVCNRLAGRETFGRHHEPRAGLRRR